MAGWRDPVKGSIRTQAASESVQLAPGGRPAGGPARTGANFSPTIPRLGGRVGGGARDDASGRPERPLNSTEKGVHTSSMARFRFAALGLAAALALASCSRPGGAAGEKNAYTRLLAHTERMVQILKDNDANPAAGLKELARYQDEHGAEVERLKQALGDYMQRDPLGAAAVSAAYGMRSAELSTRTEKMKARAAAR